MSHVEKECERHPDDPSIKIPQPYRVDDLDLIQATTQTVPETDLDMEGVRNSNDVLAEVLDSYSHGSIKGGLAQDEVFLYRHDQLRRLLDDNSSGITSVYFPKPELQDKLPSDIRRSLQQMVDEARIQVTVVRLKLDLVVTDCQVRYMFGRNEGVGLWNIAVAAKNHDIYDDFLPLVSRVFGTGLLVPDDVPLKPTPKTLAEYSPIERQFIEDANRCRDWCERWREYVLVCRQRGVEPTPNPLPHVHNRVQGLSVPSASYYEVEKRVRG